jgi:3-hydroxyisobutyrate dehydrogenase-like beta-hydroxyacid dehydrogenase
MDSARFISLRNRGSSVAASLIKNKIKLYLYTRIASKADQLVKGGARLLDSDEDLFNQTSIVFSLGANDQALREIVEEDHGLLSNPKPGSIDVSISTVFPETCQEMFTKHKERRGNSMTDCVFGRPEVAQQQKLWICKPGEAHAKRKE